MRAYAIGDIHGQADELRRVHQLISQDRARVSDSDAPVVHIGDLCDRGPDTKGVLDYLIAGQARGEPWVTIMGNHDRMMGWFLGERPLEDPHLAVGMYWLHSRLGGAETLASYGVTIAEGERTEAVHARARAAVPVAHIDFLANLPLHFELGACLFVHAGLRPGIALADQGVEDLVWIREPFLSSTADHGPLVVHGHTPVEAVMHCGNRLNIDTGAGFGHPLVAVVIEGRDVWALTEAGRVAVTRI